MIPRSIANYRRRLKMCIERDGRSVEIRQMLFLLKSFVFICFEQLNLSKKPYFSIAFFKIQFSC